jgi:hypothetical protein
MRAPRGLSPISTPCCSPQYSVIDADSCRLATNEPSCCGGASGRAASRTSIVDPRPTINATSPDGTSRLRIVTALRSRKPQ